MSQPTYLVPPAPYPANRMRRLRQHGWSRRMVAEHRLAPSDLIQPMFILDGKSQRQAIESDAGDRPALRRPLVARGRTGAGAGASRHSALPGDAGRAQERGRARGLERRQPDVPGDPGDQAALPGSGRDRRRGARPLHQPRPGRAPARRRHPQRRDDRGAGAPGGLPRCRRLRYRGALGHDGRPDRRDPQRARRRRVRADHDPILCRQIRLRLLRPVPRGGGLGGRARQGRQEDLPDGPGQRLRGPARGRAGHRGSAPTW